MRIHSTEQLGPKQSLTPEGYLLCEAVPIARTGSQLYASQELPFLESKADGIITVVREESEVFRPETMASFEGKSVTIGHKFVDPENWGETTKGTVQNVRRGLDGDADLLLADLLITDAEAIELVRVQLDDKGRPLPGQVVLREVSCGYDADYTQDAPGVAFQRNIIGNHVALVPRGRAGPRCSIQDEESMSVKTQNQPFMQRFIAAARAGDLALLKRTADAAEEEMAAEEKKAADEESEERFKKTEDAIASLTKTVDGFAAVLAKIADSMPEGSQSSAEKVEGGDKPVGDEEPGEEEKQKTADAMADFRTRAEILSPGFKTADSVRRLVDVAGVQRKALAAADKAITAPLLAGRTVDSLAVTEVATVFIAASEMARAKNNASGARHGARTADNKHTGTTPADINTRNAAFWAAR